MGPIDLISASAAWLLPIDRNTCSDLLLLPIDHMSNPIFIQSTEEFGARLRARRKELHESQSKIADVIGVNRRVLGQLEQGKATVQLQIALEAARVLGLDIELAPRR